MSQIEMQTVTSCTPATTGSEHAMFGATHRVLAATRLVTSARVARVTLRTGLTAPIEIRVDGSETLTISHYIAIREDHIMFELDEYGFMVPVFLFDVEYDDTEWMASFAYVAEIALSIFDQCDCAECCECGGGDHDGHSATCEWNGEEYPF